jgi:predicted methyltransferase MtxX (methanogen marker protein 4)
MENKMNTLNLLEDMVQYKLDAYVKTESTNQEVIKELSSILDYIQSCEATFKAELLLAKLKGKNEMLKELNLRHNIS